MSQQSASLEPPAATAESGYVFISYSRADGDLVARLVQDLRGAGVECWIDKGDLQPGTPDWDQALRDAIRGSRGVLLIASRNSRQSTYVRSEVQIAEMYRRPIFPVWAAGDQWPDCVPMGMTSIQAIDARGDAYGAAVTTLIQSLGASRLAVESPSSARASLDFEPRNPYKGLREFREEDAADFFGRGPEVASMIEAASVALKPAAEAGRILAVVGPSGSGKSSLVMAGLLPRLKRGALPGSDRWLYLDPMVPGNAPLDAMTVTLSRKTERSMRAIAADLADDSSRGLHLLASALSTRPDQPVVLLVDQFEEVFTLADDAQARRFIDILVTAATETRGPVFVILTMRADFYHQAMNYPELWKLIEPRTINITPMSVENLRDAILLPANLRDTQLAFEGDLVGDLLFEIRGQDGGLPLLQFTLDQLFQRRKGHLLTLDAYRDINGVRGALAKHADQTFDALPSDQHRDLARALFLRLIEVGENLQDVTRRRIPTTDLVLSDAAQTAMFREVASRFIDARLLTTNEIAGVSTLGVSHEAIIRDWPRLQQWILANKAEVLLGQQIRDAADVWQRSNYDESALYRGSRLRSAQAYAEANPAALNELLRNFLQESLDLQEHEQAEARARQERELRDAQQLAEAQTSEAATQRRLKQIFTVATLISFALLCVAVLAAYNARQQAEVATQQSDIARQQTEFANAQAKIATDQKDAAGRAERLAMVGRVAARAGIAGNEPSGGKAAALLSLAALRIGQRDGVVVPEARLALFGSLMSLRQPTRRETYPTAISLAQSQDRRFVAVASDDGTAIVWSVADNQRRTVSHGARIWDIAITPDGHYFATVGADGFTRLWDVRSPAIGTPVWEKNWGADVGALMDKAPKTETVANVAFGGPNGATLAQTTGDGRAWLWSVPSGNDKGRVMPNDPQTGQTAADYEKQPLKASTHNLDFSTDGCYLPTVKPITYILQLWYICGGSTQLPTIRSIDPSDEVQALAFSRDAQRPYFAYSTAKGLVEIIDPRTGDTVSKPDFGMPPEGYPMPKKRIAFSPDGTRVATAGLDLTARVFDVASGVERVRINTAQVWDITFSPDGQYLAGASIDNTVRVWDTQFGKEQARVATDDAAWSAAFSDDGQTLIAASGGDRGIPFALEFWPWRATSVGEIARIQAPHQSAAIHFSADGQSLIALDDTGAINIWDMNGSTSAPAFTIPSQSATPAVITQNRRFGAVTIKAGNVQIWDLTTRKQVGDVTFQGTPRRTVLSPDGRYFVEASKSDSATGISDKVAHVWDLQSGTLTDLPHERGVFSFSFSPDGQTLVTTSGYTGDPRLTFTTWDMASLSATRTTTFTDFNTADKLSVSVARDGRTIGIYDTASNVTVFDTVAGTTIWKTRLESPPTDLQFSPDGKHLGVVRSYLLDVWELPSGEHVNRESMLSFGSVFFSPDGQYLMWAGENGTFRIWDMVNHQEVLHLTLGRTVWSIIFSEDKRSIAVVDADRVIHVWHWDADELAKDACTLLKGDLSAEQWQWQVGSGTPPLSLCPNTH